MPAAVSVLSVQAAAAASPAPAAGTARMGEGGCEPGSVRKVRAASAAVHWPAPASLPATATAAAAAAASPITAAGKEEDALLHGGTSLTALHATPVASLPASAWAARGVAAALAGSGSSLGGMCRSTRGCWVREALRDACLCAETDRQIDAWEEPPWSRGSLLASVARYAATCKPKVSH